MSQLSKLTWPDVKEADIRLAILPWGATEAHNYHLPYGTDSFIAEYVSLQAANQINRDELRAVVLPTMAYGVNTAQIDVKLDINVNHSTQSLILTDIVESLERQNILKLVIVNSHGGNTFVPMVRELFIKSKLFIVILNTYQAVDMKSYFDVPGDHAGEMETSVMMHIQPELVSNITPGDGAAKKFKIKSLNQGWCWAQRDWLKITKDHGVGNPELASLEKGKKCMDDTINKVGKLFEEIWEADLNDLYE